MLGMTLFIYTSLANASQYKNLSIEQMLKQNKMAKVLLLLSLLLSMLFAANNQVKIYSVSTSLGVFTAAKGSTMGGTTLYISGLNFSPNAADIQIFFGPYPCTLAAEGSTVAIVSCITTPMTDPKYQTNLLITMYTANLLPVTCTSVQCRFSYDSGVTPFITEIYPRTVQGNQILSVYGYHRISDIGDGRSASVGDLNFILINNISCSILDVIQEPIIPNSIDVINCTTYKYQQAGQYNLLQSVVSGNSQLSIKTLQTGFFSGITYSIRVAAVIDNSASNIPKKGGAFGHILTLPGNSFSQNNTAAYTCTAAGQTCQVISTNKDFIQVSIPPYDASNANFGALTVDAVDTAAQTLPFAGGAGFRYTRYSRTANKIFQNYIYDMRNGNSTEKVLGDSYVTQLSHTNGDSNYIDFLRGYFYAPVDGVYNFYATSDDQVAVYLSKYRGTSNPANMVNIIMQDSSINAPDDPFYRPNQNCSASKTLTAGYYYMEVVSVDVGGNNYYTVGVSTPPSPSGTTPLANPTWQIDNILIKPTNVQPEIIQVKVTASQFKSTDTFVLTSFVPVNGVYTTVTSGTIKIGATADSFAYALRSLGFINSYGVTVTLATLDSTGAVTSVAANIATYVYSISMSLVRSGTDLKLPAAVPASGISVTTLQSHSAGLGGTFIINVNGVALKVYDGTSKTTLTTVSVSNSMWYLQSALQTLFSAPELIVLQRATNQFPNQLDFDIVYLGVNAAPVITIGTAAVTGGIDNLITTTITNKRPYASNRPLYSPISLEFLRTAETLPSIYLTLNKVPIICYNCYYQYQTSCPVSVKTASLLPNNLGLSITLSTAAPFTFDASDLTITFLSQPCVINSGTTSSFTCLFNLNSDGTAALPAGNDYPRIHIRQVGFADVSAITKLSIPLVITSFTPAAAGISGGTIATVIGSGFPLDNTQPILFISLCNNVIKTFLTVSNKQITFVIPKRIISCSSTVNGNRLLVPTTSSLTINGISQSFSFLFDPLLDPTVSALSVTSASPILKTNVNITGTNFNLDPTQMRVYLYDINGIQKYELGILSVSSTTSMLCVLGGGRSGSYYVRVAVLNKGVSDISNASMIKYQITVTSIFPISGSLGGGYNLTIKGTNFAPAKGSSQVFVGNGVNSLCTIVFINATYINCTVPSMIGTYQAGDLLPIIVAGRIAQLSTCKAASCNFSYLANLTTYLSALPVTNFNFNTSVNISSVNNVATLTGATVTVGGISVVVSMLNTTTITFKYPALTVGSNYLIVVTIGGVNAYPPIISSTNLSLGSTTGAGSNLGQIVNVSGNGFSTVQDTKNVVYYICNNKTSILPIMGMSPTNLNFTIPPNADISCKINITMGGPNFKYYTYATSAANTPTATVTDALLGKYIVKMGNLSTKAIALINARYVNNDGSLTSSLYPMKWTANGTGQYIITAVNGYLPCGKFTFDIQISGYGLTSITPSTFSIACTAITATTTVAGASYGGGLSYQITGVGFQTNNIQNNEIRVCGLRAKILSADQTKATIEIPALISQTTMALYGQYGLTTEKVINNKGIIFSDASYQADWAYDNDTSTYYSSNNSVCFIGLDFGASTVVDITKIRYMPNPNWIYLSHLFDNAVFEGSNDSNTWTTIMQIDSTLVQTGWNYWLETTNYAKVRYIRFKQTNGLSQCQLAELQFTGIIYTTITVPTTGPKACDITVSYSSGDVSTLASAVSYSPSATAIITNVSPSFGPSVGGTIITLTGINFVTPMTVTIDDIPCAGFTLLSSTSAKCTTGLRAQPPAAGNSFISVSAGNPVILQGQPFLYMDRWSSQATWGGEVLPREGDSVYVPPGMTLLMDQSTPKLNAIVVEGGKIVFSDEVDITVDAQYFVFVGGEFRAGLPSAPYQKKLTITLYGGYYDRQLPTFGNKVLGCLNCRFNMHGKVRNPTWTELATTALPGSNKITLIREVDWQIGEKIVVAASGSNHYEAEERCITAVSADKKTLTLDTPFLYKHFAAIETYAGTDFIMRSEVGLLTRNIVVQGDNNTDVYTHGSHLMFTGKVSKGLDATLSYAQFRKCGQPKIIGRYCTHFHMAGEVPNSFVRGISVHHSHARVLTIHGTHYLLVENNVGYNVKGHNIFIEDGIETRNIIQDNLMINSISSLTMLQSDTSVASYWITNPYNTVRRNHAAGSDFYGFWYEIKPNPDGPSATPEICPTGMRLGESKDNVAHSNRRFGLRIFTLASRLYPCIPTINETFINPYSENPTFESIFQNYTLWRNAENGLLGQILGFVTFDNFKVIDSGKSGMEFYKANLTFENVTVQNSIIVGYSQGNPISNNIDADLVGTRGLITPRTDGFKATNISFVNFGATMTPLQSCSKCQNFKLWVTGGKTSFFSQISYENILGNYIYWNLWRRQIFVDEDGTLTRPIYNALPAGSPTTTAPTFASLTPYWQHLDVPSYCYNINNALWNGSSYCTSEVIVKSILFTNPDPFFDFNGQTIRTFRLASPNDPDVYTDIANPSPPVSIQPMIFIKSKDIPHSWAFPFVTGQYYHVHFQFGIDFLHLALAPSMYWNVTDGLVLRFNYSDQRQLYRVAHYYQQSLQLPYITESASLIDPTTCSNGEYYHDRINRRLYTCVSGRNKQLREWTDITGLRCLSFCPTTNTTTNNRETFTRLWTNASQWPNQLIPTAGQNVTIPYEWNLILDTNTAALNYLLVNGYLIFDATKDITLEASYIWVSMGKILIGSRENPYPKNAKIILNGEKDSQYLLIDPDASGNKMLAVTGGIEFFGIVPDNIWTRLTAIAKIGDTSITVVNASGWVIGNEIVIGPSYANQTEDEVFTITAISGNTITLNDSVKSEHYGDVNIITNSYGGQIDVRAAVGLLTRNIKITKGPDANNWGCRVLIYSFLPIPEGSVKTTTPVNGYAILDGVQFDGCGQYDSSYAGLRIEKLGSLAPTTEITTITRSTMRNCNGICLYIDKSSNVSLDNNVLHRGRRFIAIVYQVNLYIFTNNLLIRVVTPPEFIANNDGTHIFPDTAAYQQYVPIIFGKSFVNVSFNLVQGSEGIGFVLPLSPCSLLDTYNFANNTAGSCLLSFIANENSGFSCVGASNLMGYASKIGFMANPTGALTSMVYQNMFFVDNQRGFTLRFAHEVQDNTMYLKNSYFMGYSRPTCLSCYQDTTISYCQSGYAIRMFTATISGEHFPIKVAMTNFDVICTQQSFDAKAFLTNVTFENYQTVNEAVPYCSGMSVFRKHSGASDATGSHNLYSTKCVNCDFESLAYFSPPNVGWRGWMGGCGQLDCTGSNNYYIHDHDGLFTGQPSQLLANNSVVGTGEGCTQVSTWNGHWCKIEDLAVLEYESIAPDFNTRIVWPIYLKYDGGAWNSTTNAWKQWSWNGNEPNNRRLARFWSVIKIGKRYNMTYSSQPPSDSIYQIQKRQMPSGNATDWVIIRIYYPIPNIIMVRVTNTTGSDIVVNSFPSKEGVYEDLNNYITVCGANNYYIQNNTIEFVVNGKNNCQVRLTVSSYMAITARLQVEVSTFFSNQGDLSFLSKLIAYLGLDPGQLKIVSVNSDMAISKMELYPVFLFKSNKMIHDQSLIFTAASPTSTVKLALYPKSTIKGETVSSNSTSNYTQANVSKQSDHAKDHNEMQDYNYKISEGIKTGALNLKYSVLNYTANITIVASNGSLATLCPNNFLYNNQTDQCYCEVNFVNASNFCVPCVSVGNGTGIVDPVDTNKCQCLSTYFWDSTKGSCFCPVNSIILPNSTCFSCTNVANSSKKADVTNQICTCNTTFSFYISTGLCLCDDLEAVIVAGKCYNCTGLANGTGKGQFALGQCQCLPTYIWNTTLSPPNCVCKYNSIILPNNTCYSCNAVGNSTNVTNVASQTCVCKDTYTFNKDLGVCQCADPEAVLISAKCFNCTGFVNGTGKGLLATSQCECSPTYIWDIKNKCVCAANSVVLSNKTCFLCTTIPNGSGSVNTTSTCGCKKSYIFDEATGSCICPDINSYIVSSICYGCTVTPNGTGKALATACECNTNYAYNQTAKACLCPDVNSFILKNNTCFGCSKLVNGSGKVGTDNASCACLASYSFNPTTFVCECPDINSFLLNKVCQSCKNFPNGTGKALAAACECNTNYVYNANAKACLCPDVNSYILKNNTCFGCSKLVNGSGKVGSDNASCGCLATYTFNPATFVCQCPDLNSFIFNKTCQSCKNFPNGTGKALAAACECNTNYIYSAKACLCPDVNSFILKNNTCFGCSKLVNGSGKVGTDNASCACLASYTFNPTTFVCECPDINSFLLNKVCQSCKNFPNGTGKALAAACECNTNYVYNANAKACLCSDVNSYILKNNTCFGCSKLVNGSGKVGADNASCACLVSYTFNPLTFACSCLDDNSVIINKLCVSCTSFSNGTGNALIPKSQCECKTTFEWITNLCLCNTSSILVSGTCRSCNLTNFNYSGKGVATNKTACLCQTNFTWSSDSTCICGVNSMYLNSKCYSCSLISKTLPSTDSGISLCLCPDTFYFDTTTFNCTCAAGSIVVAASNKCIPCTDPTIWGVARVNINTCSCGTNQQWTANNQKCTCVTGAVIFNSSCLLCSGLANSQKTSLNSTVCNCTATFIWDSNKGVCRCADDAILVAGKCLTCNAAVKASGAASPTACSCIDSTYNWNTTTNTCTCPSTSITLFNGTCALCSVLSPTIITTGVIDPYNCRCPDPYIWDNLQLACVSCAAMPFGKAKVSPVACSCVNASYVFDVYTNLCVKVCTYTGINIGLCLNCAAFAGSTTATGITLVNTSTIVLRDNTIITSFYSSVSSTLSKYATLQCKCNAGLWETTRKRCYVSA